MIRGRGDSPGRSAWALATAAVAVAVLALGLAPAAGAAPFEPNDSPSAAAGPLLSGQTYDAAIESSSDRDFFYFYVTAAGKPPATIALRNLGDGSEVIGLSAAIVNASGTPVDPFAYSLRGGEVATTTVGLEPQRYLIEVESSLEASAGIPYQLVVGGGKGAFGSYEEIAGRCARGVAAVNAARKSLQRARGKLQRASARLRQSAYGPPRERRLARRRFRQAKALVASRERRLGSAGALTRPWCSIPQ